jgi:hypothetical protein
MPLTRWAAMAAGLAVISGCAYGGYQAREGYVASDRPEASYFCYDCHGNRYFDPYYDWCTRYGFRYGWDAHPQTVVVYRERYVRIKESNPSYGRFRYPASYRASRKYREAPDYDRWRSNHGGRARRDAEPPRVREKHKADEGKNEGNHDQSRSSPQGRDPASG